MHISLLKELKNILTPEEYKEKEEYALEHKISLRQDLEWLMYAGVLLFMSGLGYFIYSQQSDSVHYIVFGVLTLLAVGLLVYLYKNKLPFSHQKVEQQKMYSDYLLLFSCLLLLSLTKYADFLSPIPALPWNILITLIGIGFIVIAYQFDHKGILSLGVSTISTLLGFNFSPEGWFKSSFYNNSAGLIIMSLFSIIIITAGYYFDSRNIKKHFTTVWYNMAAIMFFVSAIWGMLSSEGSFLFIGLTLAGAALSVWYALKVKDFLFLLYGCLGGYIAFTVLLFKLMDESFWILSFYYFLASTIGFIVFIVKRKTLLK